MFIPKVNTLNIHSIKDVWVRLAEICDDEKNYTDDELAEKLRQVYDFCNGGESGTDFYFIQHHRSAHIVEQRVKKYCKKNKIKLEDYTGILPYRRFMIEAMPNKSRDRRLKLEKIMINQKRNKFFNKIKSIWKHIL